MVKKMIGAVAAMAAVFLMAGCSAPSVPSVPVPDGQLACADALDEIKTMATDYQGAMGKIYTDPKEAVTAFDEMAKKLKVSSSTVNNKKISEAFTEMATASTQMADELRKADSDVTKINSTDFSAAGERFVKALSSVSEVCKS